MLIEETITYLEMTSPDQLVPGRPAPTRFEIERLDEASTEVLRSTYARIAASLGWISRRDWPEERWRELMSRPGFAAWVARVEGEVAGMVELDVAPDGDVEITVFGLVPDFVAKGYGGHLLTRGDPPGMEREDQPGDPDEAGVAAHVLPRSSACETKLRAPRVPAVSHGAQAARDPRLTGPAVLRSAAPGTGVG